MCPVILDLDLLAMKDIIRVFGEPRMEFEAQGVAMCQCQSTSRFYRFYCGDIGECPSLQDTHTSIQG